MQVENARECQGTLHSSSSWMFPVRKIWSRKFGIKIESEVETEIARKKGDLYFHFISDSISPPLFEASVVKSFVLCPGLTMLLLKLYMADLHTHAA